MPAERREDGSTDISHLLERERGLSECRIHLGAREVPEATVIARDRRVLGLPLCQLIEIGASHGLRVGRVGELLSFLLRMLARVEQDVRCGDHFGGRVFLAIGEVELTGARLELRTPCVELAARLILDIRHSQLREKPVGFDAKTRGVFGLVRQILALRLRRQGLLHDEARDKVVHPLSAVGEPGPDIGRKLFQLRLVFAAVKLGLADLGEDGVGNGLRMQARGNTE